MARRDARQHAQLGVRAAFKRLTQRQLYAGIEIRIQLGA